MGRFDGSLVAAPFDDERPQRAAPAADRRDHSGDPLVQPLGAFEPKAPGGGVARIVGPDAVRRLDGARVGRRFEREFPRTAVVQPDRRTGRPEHRREVVDQVVQGGVEAQGGRDVSGEQQEQLAQSLVELDLPRQAGELGRRIRHGCRHYNRTIADCARPAGV